MIVEQIVLVYKKEENAINLDGELHSNGVEEAEVKEFKKIFNRASEMTKAAYTYLRLESQRYSLIKTFTEGENLIVHGFIFNEIKNYPFEFIDSPDFITLEVPSEIEALENVLKGPYHLNPEVTDFIYTRGEAAFEEILNLMIFSMQAGETLHIVDNEKAYMNWITAILSAFPIKLASSITFTTCDFIEKDCTLHLGNKGKGKIAYDFVDGFKTEIKIKYRYSQIVRTGYFKSRSLLLSLQRFLEQFQFSELNEDIDRGALAFLMLNYSTMKFSGSDIAAALEFILNYGEEETLQTIFERYTSSFEEIQKYLDRAGSRLMLLYLIKVIKGIKGRFIFERAVKVFYEVFDLMVLNLGEDKEVLYKYYNEVEKENSGRGTFYKFQSTSVRITYLNEITGESENLNIHEIYLYILLNSLVKTGTTWNQAVHIEGFEVFVDSAIRRLINQKESLEYILNSFKSNQEFFINMLMIIFNRMERDMSTAFLADAFMDYLSSLDEGEGIRVRREVYQRGGGILLFQEYKRLIKTSLNKREFFSQYKNSTFSSIQDYSKQYYQQAVVIYLEELEPEEAFTASLDFLQEASGKNSKFDRESLQGVVEVFEKNLTLKEVVALREYIRDAAKIKRAMDIKTYPDITYLMDILFYIEENNDLSVSELIEEISFNLRGMKEENLIQYIELFFSRILLHVRSKEDHKEIIDFVFRESWKDNIIYYFNRIADLFYNNMKQGYRPFIHYISYYFYFIEPFHRGKEDGIVEYVENKIQEVFESQDRNFLEGVDKDIREEFEEKGFSIPIRWNEMYIKAIEAKTLKGKIKRIFSRG